MSQQIENEQPNLTYNALQAHQENFQNELNELHKQPEPNLQARQPVRFPDKLPSISTNNPRALPNGNQSFAETNNQIEKGIFGGLSSVGNFLADTTGLANPKDTKMSSTQEYPVSASEDSFRTIAAVTTALDNLEFIESPIIEEAPGRILDTHTLTGGSMLATKVIGYAEMASRDYSTLTLVWPASAGALTMLQLYSVEQLVFYNPQLNRCFQQHKFASWDHIKVKLMFNTNQFMCGIGRMIFMPGESGVGLADNGTMALRTAHGPFFFACEATQVEMTIPWTSNKPWLDLRQSANEDIHTQGYIGIGVIAPLRYPEAEVGNITMQIMVSVHGLRLSTPLPPARGSIQKDRGIVQQHGKDFGAFAACLEFEYSTLCAEFIDVLEEFPTHMSDTPFLHKIQQKYDEYLIEAGESILMWEDLLTHYQKEANTDYHLNMPRSGHYPEDLYLAVKTYLTKLRQFRAQLSSWEGGPSYELMRKVNAQIGVEIRKVAQIMVVANEYLASENEVNPNGALQQMSLTPNELSSIQYYPTTDRLNTFHKTINMGADVKEPGSISKHTQYVPREMNARTFCSIPGYMFSVSWSTGHIPGTVLEEYFVSPDFTASPIPSSYATPMQYLAKFAQYWSGSLAYDVMVSKSDFHTGKLAFVLSEIETEVTQQTAMMCPNIIWDVKNSNVFSFRVGMNTDRSLNWCPSHFFGNDGREIHFGVKMKISVVVWTKLMKNASMVDNVSVIFFGSGYAGPENPFTLYSPTYHTLLTYEPAAQQGSTVDVSPFTQSRDYTLLGEDSSVVDSLPHGVEPIVDIIQLLKKSQSLRYQNPTSERYMPPLPIMPQMGNSRVTNQYLIWFSRCFAFWGGDINFIVTSDVNVNRFAVMPANSTYTTYPCGAGPGVIDIKNATTYVTFKAPNICANTMHVTTRSFDRADIVENGITKYFSSYLVNTSYDSSNPTTTPAQNLFGFYSAAENFFLCGWAGLPPQSDSTTLFAEETTNSNVIHPFLKDLPEEFPPDGTTQQMYHAAPAAQFARIYDTNRDPIDFVGPANLNYDPTFLDDETPEGEDDVDPIIDPLNQGHPGFFRSIYEMPRNLNRIVHHTANAVQHSERAVGDMSGLIHRLTTQPILTSFGIAKHFIKDAIILIADAVELLYYQDTFKMCTFALKLATIIGFDFNLIEPVLNFLQARLFPNQLAEGVQQQSGPSGTQISAVLSLAVMAIGMKATGATEYDEKKITSVWELMAVRGRELVNIKSGIKAALDSYKEINDMMIECLNCTFFTDDPISTRKKDIAEIATDMKEYADIISEIGKHKNLQLLCFDTKIRKQFERVYDLNSSISKRMVYAQVDNAMAGSFRLLDKAFERICSAALDNCSKEDIRVDPFHVSIAGAPGCGKSFLSYAIMDAVCESQHREKTNRIYPRTEGMDFHDNYAGQYCYYMDDMDMIEDAEAAKQQISRKSNTPMILNMADIRKKGMYFMSKFLCSTTNTEYPNPGGLKNLEAYLRRRDILIRAEWASNSRVKHPDMSHLKFAILDEIKGGTEPRIRGLTFPQLVSYIVCTFSRFLVDQTRLIRGMNPSVSIERIHLYNPTGQVHPKVATILAEQAVRRATAVEEVNECIIQEGGGPSRMQRPLDLSVHNVDEESDLPFQGFDRVGLTGQRNEAGQVTYYIFSELDGERHYYQYDDAFAQVILNQLRTQLNNPDALRMGAERFGVTPEEYQAAVNTPWNAPRNILTWYRTNFPNSWDLMLTVVMPRERMLAYNLVSVEGINMINAIVRTPITLLRRWQDHMMDHLAPLTLFFMLQGIVLYELCIVIVMTPTYLAQRISNVLARMIVRISHFIGRHWLDYKWLIGACALGYAGYCLYKQFYPKKEDKTENIIQEGAMPIQDHHHHDLPDDSHAHSHVHLCEQCNRAFVHRHVKHSFEHSSLYAHHCKRCRDKNFNRAMAKKDTLQYLDVSLTEGDIDSDEEEVLIVNEGGAYPKDRGAKSKRMRVKLEGGAYPKDRGHKIKRPVVRLEGQAMIDLISPSLTEEDLQKLLEYEIPEPVVDDKRVLAETYEPEMQEKEDAKKKALNIMKSLVQEGTSDPNSLELQQKVLNNTGVITYGAASVNYLGLKGLKILVPAHLFALGYNNQRFTISITRMGVTKVGTIRADDIVKAPPVYIKSTNSFVDRDMLVVDLINMPQVASFSNIMSHFVSEMDVDLIGTSSASLIGYDSTLKEKTRFSIYTPKVRMIGSMATPGIRTYAIFKGIEYEMPTREGYCGSTLVVYNTQMPSKIVGMHVAGHSEKNLGFSQIIWRELLDEMCGEDNYPNGPPLDYLKQQCSLEKHEELRFIPEGDSVVLGKSIQRGAGSTLQSDIIPSPLFDVAWKHVTEPAVLTANDPRRDPSTKTPMQQGMDKFSEQTGNWNIDDRTTIKNYMFAQFVKATQDYPGPKRILTLDEAINGVPGFFDGLNMRTSPGYPYVLERPSCAIGKTYLFEEIGILPSGQIQYKCGKKLQADIDNILEIVKTERWCIHNFYMDWLKDERRPLEKIVSGKTRTFNIHSVAWLIINRMYFGAYVACYIWTKFRIGSSLGINMHGYDVTSLVNFLSEVGDANFWDGDVKRWDSGLDNETLYDQFWIASKWNCRYDPTADYLDCLVVASSLFWRIHVNGLTFYLPSIGMPSGSLWTSVGNTGTHNERKYLVWNEVVRDVNYRELAHPRHCDEHTREVKNGDDSLGNVSEFAKDFYTPENVAEIFAKHGIEMVPPTKIDGNALGSFRCIEQTRFLKCSFKRDETYQRFWHMTMELDTIHELTNWIRKSTDSTEALESNVLDALTFAYAHGRDTFDETKSIIEEALTAKDLDIVISSTFDELDQNWRSNHDLQ